MNDCHKHKLLGKYRPPDVEEGDILWCEVRRCWVPVEYLSDSPLPWPVGRRPGFAKRSLVVYGGLSQALRRESASAIAAMWGVHPTTISRWKRALNIGQFTEGTLRVRAARTGPEHMAKMRSGLAKLKAARPGWTPGGRLWSADEDEVVMTLPTKEAMVKTGRSLHAVRTRRQRLARLREGRPVVS